MDDDAYDLFAGDIVELLLEDAGVVERELRVSSRAQRLDAAFTPTRRGLALLQRRGLLGRLAQRVCVFEFFHHAPSLAKLREVARKHLTWQHQRVLHGATDMSALWVVCASRPGKALCEVRATRSAWWPRGVYDVSTPLTGMRVVVVGELAATPDTLTLRLMGRGAVLRAAMQEFKQLPKATPERVLADAVIEFMERKRTETAMSERTDYLRRRARELLDEAVKNELEARNKEQRRREDSELLSRLFARRLRRELTAMEQTALRTRLDLVGPARMGDVVIDLDGDALAAWLADPDAR